MLEPRETDLPALFVVFVVLPLVTYILLGKWSEAAKKKERISLLAQMAAEEALRAEAMAAASVIPFVPLSKNGIHECARCYAPATTRCSRCKSVRYCSGKCQIFHWRQVHGKECQQLENNSSSSSPKLASNEESISVPDDHMDSQCFGYNIKQPRLGKTSSDDIIHPPVSTLPSATASCMSVDTSGVPMMERRSIDKRVSRKSNREMLKREDGAILTSAEEASRNSATRSTFSNITSKEANMRHKLRGGDSVHSEEENPEKYYVNISDGFSGNGHTTSRVARIRDTIPAQGSGGVASTGLMKMIGLMKSSKQESSEVSADRHKKIKMLFPYEEFVKFFQYEVFDLSPRGLINCGNSCYANAVLQCLTCTKPLTVYLLRRSHSRACCAKDWCLMCELEQHVLMLRESGSPLSPSRILLHMRSINCQIGDGSQEDAHEFLRLLVTSMQSICLEGLGGENVVDPRLQETTFVQHTFGGRLRSKVKCLRCHHESERFENIMDLTLEIFGWVESLEDALTQFTSLEDLDGENMYRCGRCAAYVRARKQLSIQEAPNILTIVLKRFQEGSYGKINKCITFPDMLDMIPFMTGTDDIPPLYMLYAVVVHLDTLNASFSGHYVSYVKDLRGNWFRIDDTQVLPVPMSQVMSEGAYILFYMRSFPRPARACTGKTTRHQASGFAKHWTSKAQKSSRLGQSKLSSQSFSPEPSSDHRSEMAMVFTKHPSNAIIGSATRNRSPVMEAYVESRSVEFSDATTSDWSLFTSSDEASFTTESTRDSFSTVDYADACNIDPISSIFNTLYAHAPEYSSHKSVTSSRISSSKSQTRFGPEGKGYVLDSYLATQPLDGVWKKERNLKQVSVPSTEAFPSGSNCGAHVKYGSNPRDGPRRTSSH